MKLIKSKNANENYLAKIVDIQNFNAHPNPEVTRLKCAHVDGWNIIVGIDEPEGKYIYFPTSSQINENLLSYASLYRHKEKNANPEKTGFFEDNGRVKAIKLKNLVSEGFLMPLYVLQNFIVDNLNIDTKESEFSDGTEFDSIEHNGKEFWICKKYIIKIQHQHSSGGHTKKPKGYSKVIENQFRFHYETSQYKKNPYFVQPNDLIHISSKIHGTSHISANVLCNFKRNLFDRIAISVRNLFHKDKIDAKFEQKYDYLYSSRSVIKNAIVNKKDNYGYYGVDVWKEADKILKPVLQKGMTIYAEIVGFLPNGNYIQKNYDYGCVPPKENEYIHETNFKVRPYRITLTNVDGQVHEFSPKEVQIWCKNNGLVPVTELYYGKASDLYPELSTTDKNWNERFIEKLADDKDFFMEMDSPDCYNKVPHEGIVIKVDDMIPKACKLKAFRFLSGEQEELDKGIENIEDNA